MNAVLAHDEFAKTDRHDPLWEPCLFSFRGIFIFTIFLFLFFVFICGNESLFQAMMDRHMFFSDPEVFLSLTYWFFTTR